MAGVVGHRVAEAEPGVEIENEQLPEDVEYIERHFENVFFFSVVKRVDAPREMLIRKICDARKVRIFCCR